MSRRDAGNQAAAANTHIHVGHAWQIFEDLQSNGSLTCCHEGIIERMNPHEPLGLEPLHLRESCMDIGSEHHGGAIAAGGVYIISRGARRHDNGGGDSQVTGGEGNALRMVSAAYGHDAAASFRFGEGKHLVERAARLERPGLLQALQL